MKSVMAASSRFSSNGIALTARQASVATSGIMLGGFLMSVLCAMVFKFKATTKTHCRVDNYLPSISAAIAEPPSSYVWRFAVTLCSSQRLAAIFFHHSMYSSIPLNRIQYRCLVHLSAFFELVENVALITLTCVSSVDNHKVHENSFIVFQLSATLFMGIMCMVHKLAITHGTKPTQEEHRMLMRKLSLFIINLVAFSIAVYFYYRHNRYCEAGVYTIFAFLEYIVVTSNIGFHFLVSYNFGERELRVGCRPGLNH